MSIQDRIERFDSFFADGRILRGAWTGKDQEGRETACLLAALLSEVADAESPSACPADVLPAWLAHVVPLIDDETTEGYWPEAMCRFSDCLHLIAEAQPTKEKWRRIESRWLVSVVDEAKRHTDSDDALNACDVVRGLLMRAATGDEPTAIEWASAAARASSASAWASAAWARAEAWAAAARAAAEAAAWAASASARASEAASAAWAESAAEAAARAAAEEAAAWSAKATAQAEESAEAAEESAWDRMAASLFDAIEVELLAVQP